jgi:hypothetical protein
MAKNQKHVKSAATVFRLMAIIAKNPITDPKKAPEIRIIIVISAA